MAQTQGGMVCQPVAPPRVFITHMGVKVRKINGGYVYQPASLKASSYLTLDRHFPDSKNRKLYENVQKGLDNLVSRVEDEILGIETTDTKGAKGLY